MRTCENPCVHFLWQSMAVCWIVRWPNDDANTIRANCSYTYNPVSRLPRAQQTARICTHTHTFSLISLHFQRLSYVLSLIKFANTCASLSILTNSQHQLNPALFPIATTARAAAAAAVATATGCCCSP